MASGVRRVVTGHNAQGRAVVAIDDRVAATEVVGGEARFVKLWTTDRSPADNMDPGDGSRREVGLTSPGGTVLRIVDMAPGHRSPMHRTHSLDYGIVLAGEIELELDDGAITRVKAGEVVVQRGTIHAWINPGPGWCRMAFVLIDAAPVLVAGRPLGPAGF